jgi:hypothetical protein
MKLLPNTWYARIGQDGETLLRKTSSAKDILAGDGWQEIEPPTIVLKKKDLSHAKVGDIVESTDTGNRFEVLYIGAMGAILMNGNMLHRLSLRASAVEPCGFPSYTLIS